MAALRKILPPACSETPPSLCSATAAVRSWLLRALGCERPTGRLHGATQRYVLVQPPIHTHTDRGRKNACWRSLVWTAGTRRTPRSRAGRRPRSRERIMLAPATFATMRWAPRPACGLVNDRAFFALNGAFCGWPGRECERQGVAGDTNTLGLTP